MASKKDPQARVREVKEELGPTAAPDPTSASKSVDDKNVVDAEPQRIDHQEEADTTAATASRPVNRARNSLDLQAAPSDAIPPVAGVNASKEETEEALRIQSPNGRNTDRDRVKVTLKDGTTLTVHGNVERVRAKVNDGRAISLVDENGESSETFRGDEVRRIEPVKSKSKS